MTCCQTKVFGFIATFYKLKLLSLYDRSSDNVYKTFCYNIYNVTLSTQFRIPIRVGFLAKLCHVLCNNLSLDYCALMCCHLQQICWNIKNHLYENFYCLVFPRTKKSEAHGKSNPK